jgi:vacuolar-type H+-ATPase subunit H
MEDDVLAKVISAEKEIQACLEAERTRAREWLEEVRKETEEECIRAEERIMEASKMSAEQARDEAMARAKNIVSEAETRAERLLNLSDKTLREIIMRRLNMILLE